MNEPTASHPEYPAQRAGWVLILEPSEEVSSEIASALAAAVPGTHVEIARNLEDAQRLVLAAKPDLFVLDLDATYNLGQDFLYDLRTSHPSARAIILTAIHLAAHREQAQGLGAIHFLEKPFPREDFAVLAQALLDPSSTSEGEKFQGTLSDLHIADIIQLKCMSGATSVLEFTGPHGEKARVFFEEGQVRHATAPGKEGITAFNEIVNWKGGMISEVSGAGHSPSTIDLDWQLLLMEAVRKIDETRDDASAASSKSAAANGTAGRKVLVIDDSLMLLSFVCEILTEANYHVTNAATAQEGLKASTANPPDLILLDYVLPDMKGDEVSRRLLENAATKSIPILYMSGMGTDLQPDALENSNVIGFLNKPFTSETLIRTIEKYIPKSKAAADKAPADILTADEPSHADKATIDAPLEATGEVASAGTQEPLPDQAAEEKPAAPQWWSETQPAASFAPAADSFEPAPAFEESAGSSTYDAEPEAAPAFIAADGGAFFSGDTNFFSMHWALQTVAKEKLTGTLRCFWDKATVELLAEKGRVVLVTTRDPELYCPEAPITLVNVDADKIAEARANQTETGAPLFVTLASDGLILREPAQQLVQHYGQKLFAQLWTARRVRFVFEQSPELPDYARDAATGEEVDQWSLGTLRFVQYQDLGSSEAYDPESIPAYTRDGFERVQNLRLTVAEAQFASQFNGVRSIQQIAKNLRLDLKFARLTLFRFLALEIVECWPPNSGEKTERRGLLQRIGFGG